MKNLQLVWMFNQGCWQARGGEYEFIHFKGAEKWSQASADLKISPIRFDISTKSFIKAANTNLFSFLFAPSLAGGDAPRGQTDTMRFFFYYYYLLNVIYTSMQEDWEQEWLRHDWISGWRLEYKSWQIAPELVKISCQPPSCSPKKSSFWPDEEVFKL